MAEQRPVFTDVGAYSRAVPGSAQVANAAPVYEAVGGVAEAAMKIAGVLYRQDQEQAILDAKLTIGKSFQSLSQKAQKETNWTTIEQTFNEGADALGLEVVNAQKDGYTQKKIREAFEYAKMSAEADVAKVVMQKKTSTYLAGMAVAADALQTSGLNDPDPGMPAAKSGIKSLADGAFFTGAAAEDKAKQWEMQQLQLLDYGRARRDIQNSPQEAFARLQEDGNYASLKGSVRTDLRAEAQSQLLRNWETQNRIEEAKRKESERLLKNQQDGSAVDAMARLSQGNITVADINARRTEFSKEDYNRLVMLAAKEDALSDDRRTWLKLYGDVYDGVDSRAAILKAGEEGLITKSTASALLAGNRTIQEAGGPSRVKKPVDIWRTWLHTEFFGQGTILDKFDQGRMDRGANAMAEFETYAAAHPGLGGAEMEKEAKRIRDQWGRNVHKDTTSNLPLPSADVMAGNRAEPDFQTMKINNERIRFSNPKLYEDNAKRIGDLFEAKRKRDEMLGAPDARPR